MASKSVVSVKLFSATISRAQIARLRLLHGTRITSSSVVEFFGVILVPLGNFHDDVGRAVGDGLAAEARLGRNSGSHIEFVEFCVGGFVAGLEALFENDVASGAGTDA